MWFKKKSVLQAEGNYNTEKSADNTTDLRTTYKYYDNTNISITNSGLPSAAEANKYFYLPALGYYDTGRLTSVNHIGNYWSSSADPSSSGKAYYLGFLSIYVRVNSYHRRDGYRAEVLQ